MQEDIIRELSQKPRKLLIKCECGHYHSLDEIAIVEYLVGKNCEFDPSKVVRGVDVKMDVSSDGEGALQNNPTPANVPPNSTWGGYQPTATPNPLVYSQPAPNTNGATPNKKVKKMIIPPSFRVGDKTIPGMSIFTPPPELQS